MADRANRKPPVGRVDFHLHSYASNVTDYYTANTLAIPESYSDPIRTHAVLKSRGMDLVTLTDHNSIDGVLEMLDAGLPDVFVSAEMTTTFPEDGCNIHVTVANVTEAQFREVDRLRANVYDMVDYLDRQIAAEGPGDNRLVYFMTHPLMSTQNRPYGREGSLSLQHIEKALLLCNMIEVRNGTRTPALNELTWQLVKALDRQRIERLAEVHGIEPKGPTPWLKTVVGGSDDHCGINPGRTWTEFACSGDRPTVDDLVTSMRQRETRPAGDHGGPITLAHAVVKLVYDRQHQSDARDQQSIRVGGPINGLLRFAFADRVTPWERTRMLTGAWFRRQVLPRVRSAMSLQPSFEHVLADEATELLMDAGFRSRLATADTADDRIFEIISALVNRMFVSYCDRIRSANSIDLIRTTKDLVSLASSQVFVALPYMLAFSQQSSDRRMQQDVSRAFDLPGTQRLALVTDTLFDVNGVAKTIRRMMREAEQRGVDLTVFTSLAEAEHDRLENEEVRRWIAEKRLVVLPAIVDFGLPRYEGLRVRCPAFLELLRHLQEGGYHKLQISTPGTVGVCGLMAAKLLQIETSATYHTSFPEYVESYTGDLSLEATTWRYMIWFYDQVDEVVVPSRFIGKQLAERGLRNRNVLVLDRWVDEQRFRPHRRTVGFFEKYGLQREDELVKFLYVGRVAEEKNLDVLADAYRELRERHADAHLIIVGDGPYREALAERLSDLPVTFTGFLHGDDLPRALASADVKVFPSTTDTWGNAPLEAQASGIPVIVTDRGGPRELVDPNATGFVVRGRDVDALCEAMTVMMDLATRRAMGWRARDFVETHRVEQPFSAILDSAAYRRNRSLSRTKGRRSSGVAPGPRAVPTIPAGRRYSAVLR